MRAPPARRMFQLALVVLLSAPATESLAQSPQEPPFTVTSREIVDYKSVLATVRSRDRIEARVRTPGTITKLNVDEGTQVKAGEQIATVVDDKLEIKVKGIDARITALETRVETARADLTRARQLVRRKVSPQIRLEQAQTVFEAAEGDLKTARAERSVIEAQSEEGNVLAPADGRVVLVPVTVGSVVMPGENIATIAANEYLLRLELPERHARFIAKGDEIKLGQRGMQAGKQPANNGRIVQVYPQLSDGRVVADAKVDNLGNYFVGERALVWISAGKRTTLMVPRAYTFQRFSLDYVKLATDKDQTIDVVVQLGRQPQTGTNGDEGLVEVLAGLRPGDVVLAP